MTEIHEIGLERKTHSRETLHQYLLVHNINSHDLLVSPMVDNLFLDKNTKKTFTVQELNDLVKRIKNLQAADIPPGGSY